MIELVLLLATVALGLYFYLRRNVGYFRSRGVFEMPSVFLWGSEATKNMYTGKRTDPQILALESSPNTAKHFKAYLKVCSYGVW